MKSYTVYLHIPKGGAIEVPIEATSRTEAIQRVLENSMYDLDFLGVIEISITNTDVKGAVDYSNNPII